ncbi:MAG: hypothetical protein ABFD75_06600 [Smithella sp.]
MYGLNSLLIAGVLFVSMAVAMEAGYRIGHVRQRSASDAARSHVNAIQASLLGVLALLLGFTFSLALQRFDKRSEAVVDEANAIGTTYLRAQLLPNSVRSEARKLLQKYVDYRVRAGAISLDNEAERQVHIANARDVLDEIWGCALRAAKDDKSPVTAGLFIQSLNETIDSFGRRNAELNRHVPEVIWLLLYGTFLITGGVLGYSAGLAGHRPSLVTYILVALIVVLAFIIIDLDRPRRGLIQVDQTSLTDLKTAIDLAQSAGVQPTAPAKLSYPEVTGRR